MSDKDEDTDNISLLKRNVFDLTAQLYDQLKNVAVLQQDFFKLKQDIKLVKDRLKMETQQGIKEMIIRTDTDDGKYNSELELNIADIIRHYSTPVEWDDLPFDNMDIEARQKVRFQDANPPQKTVLLKAAEDILKLVTGSAYL